MMKQVIALSHVQGPTPMRTSVKERKVDLADQKKRMAHIIISNVRERGWSLTEAGKYFGISVSRMSSLNTGKIDNFSLDYMFTMLASLGYRPNIQLSFQQFQ